MFDAISGETEPPPSSSDHAEVCAQLHCALHETKSLFLCRMHAAVECRIKAVKCCRKLFERLSSRRWLVPVHGHIRISATQLCAYYFMHICTRCERTSDVARAALRWWSSLHTVSSLHRRQIEIMEMRLRLFGMYHVALVLGSCDISKCSTNYYLLGPAQPPWSNSEHRQPNHSRWLGATATRAAPPYIMQMCRRTSRSE